VNVREPIVALGDLDPALPVVAQIVATGELIPIDVARHAAVTAHPSVGDPATDVAVLGSLEDWQAG
jgi:hypothetical protein